MKRNSKRKGFTLVELLIVIVVIGILSAMMMISSTEAVASARAATIIGNMRTIKTATLAWYIDRAEDSNGGPSGGDPTMSAIIPYLGTGNANGSQFGSSGASYEIVTNSSASGSAAVSTAGGGTWYVKCTVQGDAAEKGRVLRKLANRASSAGLVTSTGGSTVYSGSGSEVYMKIM